MSRSSITEPRTCPVCDAPADPAHTPFCSRGCRDRDLLRWLGEGYALPARSDEDEGLDSPPPATL